MKNETKASLIIFCAVFVLAYVMMCFVPDELITYPTENGSLLSFLGDATVTLVGLRGVLAFSIALITALLVRIVDPEEHKKVAKKETKKTK